MLENTHFLHRYGRCCREESGSLPNESKNPVFSPVCHLPSGWTSLKTGCPSPRCLNYSDFIPSCQALFDPETSPSFPASLFVYEAHTYCHVTSLFYYSTDWAAADLGRLTPVDVPVLLSSRSFERGEKTRAMLVVWEFPLVVLSEPLLVGSPISVLNQAYSS